MILILRGNTKNESAVFFRISFYIYLIIENPTLKSLIMQGYSRHEGTDIKDELVRTKQRHHINIILMLNTVEDDLDTLQTLKLILEGNGFI